MNWLDVALIMVGVVFLALGLKVGMLRAVFMAGGLIIGLVLAAQISGPLAELLTDSVGSDSIATVVAYAIVLAAVVVAAQVVGAIVRRIVQMLLLGWVDILAGGVLGAAAGALAGLGVVAVVSRLAILVPEDLETAGRVVEVRGGLERALLGSVLAPYYIDTAQALPGDALGLLPADFSAALEEVDRRIERET